MLNITLLQGIFLNPGIKPVSLMSPALVGWFHQHHLGSPMIREMQIKTTVRYHLRAVGMAIIKTNKC